LKSLLPLFTVLFAASGAAEPVDFARDVQPILSTRCYSCHGAKNQMSGLRLDRRDDALRGGYSGPVIVPGKAAESKLILRVNGTGGNAVMPAAGPRLTPEQIKALHSWIDEGARWPEAPASAAASALSAKPAHWAFQPVGSPNPPAVKNRSWVRNPIDNFVLAKLESEGIRPSPEASKNTLVRRLFLDLTGIPPTPEEVAGFVSDKRPDAWERLVDQLLQSEHYGEKWAMHWLDLARYADSDGYEKDLFRPYAWRYRHWLINALNRDVPFDRFTIEQIAGDLLPNATTDQKIATGFYRNTLKNREGGVNPEQFRFEETLDRANAIGTVWLGLTVGCAQCHDHKYDPISQRNYYQLFAFANNLQEINIDAPLAGEVAPYLDALPGYQSKRAALLKTFNVPTQQPDWEKQIILAADHPGQSPVWDRALDIFQKSVDDGEKILRKPLTERTWRECDAITDHFVRSYGQIIGAEKYKETGFGDLAKQLKLLKASFPDISRAQTVSERPEARQTHIHIRGNWQNTGITVEPGVPSFLPPLGEGPEPARLKLARWLVSKDNPLTARVAVNRMWQDYFGAGLVRSADNFGTQGLRPSHPELLDWLAREFIARGWSVKQMHRLIVTSSTYRQSSNVRQELLSRDPDNSLLSRQSRLRLPGELIRDSSLAVSGLLDPQVGGKSIRPPLPAGVTMLGYADGIQWEESTGKDRYRRGLYIAFQRSVPYPQLVNFDIPKRDTAVCTRERSNTPLQALNVLNDPVFHEASQALARRILTSATGLKARIDYGFRLCLARQPSPGELAIFSNYYGEQVSILRSEPESVAKLMPAAPPGIDAVEAATWVVMGSVFLNLDEFMTRN
jgi:mono/diheme cytochrome c family protein